MNSSKIPDLLEKITQLIGSSSFPRLSSLERDLLLQHLREMYEETLLLNGTKTVSLLKDVTVMQEPDSQITETGALTNKSVLHSNESLLINEPVVVREVKTIQIEDKPIKREAINQPTSKATTINERTPAGGSLNQKLKTGNGKEVHKILATKPLRELIDLNKKFALVNELFKGNSESFSQAVNRIDGLKSFDEAEQFITEELSFQNNWDKSSQPSRLFMSLVKQRFGVE